MLAAVKGELCNRNVLFANNIILHRQDFGTVALLVYAEHKGRVDTLDS